MRKMKVFKFYTTDNVFNAWSGETEEIAKNAFIEDGQYSEDDIVKVEEVPESEWDKKRIRMYEDNDFDTEPFYVSINEMMFLREPEFIYTNDTSSV